MKNIIHNDQALVEQQKQELETLYKGVCESIEKMLKIFTDEKSKREFDVKCVYEIQHSDTHVKTEVFLALQTENHRVLQRIYENSRKIIEDDKMDLTLVKSILLGGVLEYLTDLAYTGEMAVLCSGKLSPMKSFLDHHNSIDEIVDNMQHFDDVPQSKYYAE